MPSSANHSLRLLPPAIAEYEAAVRWYKKRALDTARHFQESIDRTLSEIAQHPLRFPTVYRDRRKALTAVFPYQIIYVTQPDVTVVLSISHTSRHPAHWQYRLLPHERPQ